MWLCLLGGRIKLHQSGGENAYWHDALRGSVIPTHDGALGGLEITIRDGIDGYERKRKLVSEERGYFWDLLECLAKEYGWDTTPNNELMKPVYEHLCSSAFQGGSASWRAYFARETPQEKAAVYARHAEAGEF